MKKRQLIIVGASLFLIIGSVALQKLLGGMKEEPKKKEVPVAKKYVKTQKVAYSDIPTFVIAHGRVATSDNLDLIAEKQGRMTQGSIRLKEGKRFRKGDLLFRIDDKEASLNLQSQKSNFLKDLAAILPDFRVDFPESYQKWNIYFESIDLNKKLPELPKLTSNKEKTYLATKNIFSSYYSIKSSEEALTKYRLYAPFNGIISEVFLQSGSYVGPGSKIAKIHRTDSYEIKVAVETSDIGWVQKGMEVQLGIENSYERWLGKVVRIGELVNENTQSIDVFIALNRNETDIYHGMYLRSVIPGEAIGSAMEVPRGAVFNTNLAYVVKDSLLVEKKVNVLRTNTETVVINGLELGDDLVYEPLINAHNGMKVYKLSDKIEADKQINLEKKEVETLAAAGE
jgi:multidrug efflux pump subunit AcrA (membrane-fusion protein)